LEKHWDILWRFLEDDICECIFWKKLCSNTNAHILFESHWEYIINLNIRATTLLHATYPNANINNLLFVHKKRWYCLCSNINNIGFIETHWTKISQYIDNDCFVKLCQNPNAISFVEKHWDEIHSNILKTDVISSLCYVYVSNTIPFLKKHWTQINPLLDKHCWNNLSINPNIFEDEYISVCKSYFREKITEEIMQVVWHPRNIHKFEYLL
jgi:hypothetical protein